MTEKKERKGGAGNESPYPNGTKNLAVARKIKWVRFGKTFFEATPTVSKINCFK
jgi:hypothetical protein